MCRLPGGEMALECTMRSDDALGSVLLRTLDTGIHVGVTLTVTKYLNNVADQAHTAMLQTKHIPSWHWPNLAGECVLPKIVQEWFKAHDKDYERAPVVDLASNFPDLNLGRHISLN